MGKNIVIFSDGTGQEGGVGNNTNVYQLFNLIEDRTRRQITFYDRGLGTGWVKVGQITGGGITRNIRECYQFLADNYAAGDRIYLFGFSRGATTVRTLSAFIHLFGILPRSRPELIKRAWRIYKVRNPDKKRRLADRFVHLNHTMWAQVRLLGVWDTVAALGLPFKTLDVLVDKIPFWRHSFHDLSLARSVQYARHALSIDDERKTFEPQLWDERGRPQTDGASRKPAARFTVADCFSVEDITDIFLVAEKLKAPDHPVSKRLQLSAATRKLLDRFDHEGHRTASPEAVAALKEAVVSEFNKMVFSTDQSIYDPKWAEEFEGITLASATRARFEQFRKSRRNSVRWLDRQLIQEAYSLRPGSIPRVKQVWFTGMHTDVGGGYPDNDLAHIPLVWMIREAIDLGLLVYPKHRVDLTPDATGRMHDSRAGLGRLYRRRRRSWDREKNQGRSPLVHESVVVRSRCDDPIYEPWILKTNYDLEPWPERQRRSIQFDDHNIWREALWGWDGAFAVRWSAVERIACDEQERTVTLHLKGGRKDIVIRGCLPKALPALVSQLERRREHKRLEEEDQRLQRQDEKFNALLQTLEEKVASLESRIQLDDERPSRRDRKGAEPRSRDQELTARDRRFREEIAELRAQISELSAASESQPPAEDDPAPDALEH